MTMGNEIWKSVVGYEGLYEVSNLGRIRSLDRLTIGKDGGTYIFKGRILKPWINKCGHSSVVLHKNGKGKGKMVHVLVMESFVGPRPNGADVIHLEHVKINNNNTLKNLRYCSRACNMAFKYDDGTIPNQKGENSPQAKLKEKEVIEIKEKLENSNLLQREIAEKFNVAVSTISMIATGKTWGHLNA